MDNGTNLKLWIAQQKNRSAATMERAISATHLVRRRESFGQVVVPAVGSVLASPVTANWDPTPDYFFHWVRDAAAVMRALVDLMEVASHHHDRIRYRKHFGDIVRFSLKLTECDGATLLRHTDFRRSTRPDAVQFLRSAEEVGALKGERLLGEPRFNADGSIDFFRWSRPQYDGPALRALACLAYIRAGGAANEALRRLLQIDLEYTLHHAGQPCVGPWEEEVAQHYSVALVQLGALSHGSHFLENTADLKDAEQRLRAQLDRHWSETHQIYMAFGPAAADVRDDLIDGSQLLAVLDAGLPDGAHSLSDVRVQKTVKAIEELFAQEFPLNAGRPAPGLGRYRRDSYFGGGVWFPTTLAAATFYYRLAQREVRDRQALIGRGDEFMATVRGLAAADGSLGEQVDRTTGRPTSVPHLTWSHAAFVSAAIARKGCPVAAAIDMSAGRTG